MDIPDKLRLLNTISSDGNFSEVFLCENTYLNNRKEAVKFIHIDHTEEGAITNKVNESLFESSVLEYLGQSDYIVKIYDAQILEKGFRINMEYLENGSLQGLINRVGFLDNKTIFRVAECILCGLEYAHCKNILHLDVKPGNILIKNDNVYKLSDFGLAGVITHEGSSNFRMVYNNHVPPESIDSNVATNQSDIYMFGVTMYRLLNGDSHFMGQIDGMTYDKVCENIRKGKFPSRNRYMPHVPIKLRKTVNKCLEVDLGKRYKSIREIRSDIGKLKLTYNWKIISSTGELIRWEGYYKETLVYEIICLKSDKGWEIQFLKLGKKHIKVGKYCYKGLSIEGLNSKLEVIFSEFF